jgi:hypothetical protein
VLCITAAIDGAVVAAIVLALVGAALGMRILSEASWALAMTIRALSEERGP